MFFKGPFHPKPFRDSPGWDVRSLVLACRGYPKLMQSSSLASRTPPPQAKASALPRTFLCFSPLLRSWQGFATTISLCGLGSGQTLAWAAGGDVLQQRQEIGTAPGHCAPPFLLPCLAQPVLTPLSHLVAHLHPWRVSLAVLSRSLSINYLLCLGLCLATHPHANK